MRKQVLSNKAIRILLAAVFWTAAWQFAAWRVGIELLLPHPLTALRALWAALQETDFWLIVLKSLVRVFGGFLVGLAIGAVLAVLTTVSRLCDAIFAPAIRMIRAVPVASFIILALIWLESTILPAFIAGLIVLPVVWSNLCEGIRQTSPELLELARVYRFGRIKTLRRIYIPSVAPYFQSASVTALGLAWKSGIAAEVLCQPREAIGTQLYYAKIYLETERLFAWTIVVIALSFLVEVVLTRLLRWMGGGRR